VGILIRDNPFSGPQLQNKVYNAADMTGANLSGLKISGVNLAGASIDDADLSGMRINGGAVTDLRATYQTTKA